VPVAEDHGRQGDEAHPRRHPPHELVEEADGEVGPRQARQHPGEDDPGVAEAVDVHPQGVGGLGVLPHGPEAEAKRGLEEDPPGHGHQEEGQVDQGGEAQEEGEAVRHLLGVGGVAVEVGEDQARGP